MRVPAHEAPWNLRRTASGDVPAVLDFVTDGIQGYRDFAPATWVPPFENSTAKVERTLAELADPGTFSRVTEVDGRIAGFVHWCEPDPPVAIRLRFLFVAKPFWGTGLARLLHDESVAAMGARTARLFTPSGQGRARRFYERGGWTVHAELETSELGIPLVEYRRPCAPTPITYQEELP